MKTIWCQRLCFQAKLKTKKRVAVVPPLKRRKCSIFNFFFIKITTLKFLTAFEADENVFARNSKKSNAVLN